jgi:hypothetical protein
LEKEIYTKIRSVLGRKIFGKGRERERQIERETEKFYNHFS